MKSGRGDRRDRPLHVRRADQLREPARDRAFERYVQDAAGVDTEELPSAELVALRTIYSWGTGPKQIVRAFEGETFAQMVERVEARVLKIHRTARGAS